MPEYPRLEEIVNAVTHGAGAVLSALGFAALLWLDGLHDDWHHTLAVVVYGTTLTFLYLVSTLYHCSPHGRVRALLRVLDHVSIFFLIAGTYTPFTLVILKPPSGWIFFGAIWLLALAGAAFKVRFTGRHEAASVAFYIALGWLGIVVVEPIMQALEPAGLFWLVGGGVLYTGGVVFYAWKRMPFNHAVWHLFVLGGSACHFLSVLWYVVPSDPP